MAMSKQDFIALADVVKQLPQTCQVINGMVDIGDLTEQLAQFCKGQNSNFLPGRWKGYIAGENGKSGGKVKAA